MPLSPGRKRPLVSDVSPAAVSFVDVSVGARFRMTLTMRT